MDHRTSHCPACGRVFRSILDYPRVRILAFERLAIPEALDTLLSPGGINRTPQIARACGTPEVRDYLARLATKTGHEVAPADLSPPFKPSDRFKWAYPIGDTGIYLALADAAVQTGDERAAEVQVHCDGPNLGSAGGPTLQPLGAIALLRYQGLLAEGFR